MARAIAAFLGVILVAACARAPEPTEPGPQQRAGQPDGDPFETFAKAAPRLGEEAPDFRLAKVGGGTVSLAAEFADRPVVLVFGSYS